MRALLTTAIAGRRPLLAAGHDAVRLVDGSGDGLPGLWIESFAGRWLVSTAGRETAPGLLDWLQDQQVACYWKRLDRHQKEPPAWLCGPLVSAPFLITEAGVKYEISFQSGYSQGLFLDQRNNRMEVRRIMGPGQRLLNTFAYTGAFSVAAAMAGATTTTLDLSQPYLDWAKRNFSHNALDPAQHYFCKGDAFHWLQRFAKQARTFDGIVLDPPTFSRDDHGRVFRVESDYGRLAALAAELLAPGGWLLCCTNFRGLDHVQFERILRRAVPRASVLRHMPMPADFTGEPYLKSVWLAGRGA